MATIVLGTNGYCTVANVQSLHQQRTFSATTKPTSTEVEEFITDGFGNINGGLTVVGYTIPVAIGSDGLTYPQSAGILKTINVNYALFRVTLASYSAGVGIFPDGAAAFREDYNTAIKAMRDGIFKLPDAPQETDFLAAQNEQDPDGEFNLDTVGDEQGPIFYRDTKTNTGSQW